MPTQSTDFYNDLQLSLALAWKMLVVGSSDRRTAFHTPCVTTIDKAEPSSRIMVLRSVDAVMRKLRFHTDIRSAKVAHLELSHAVSVLCYDSTAKIQLRLNGFAEILTEGPSVDLAWKQISLYGRRCYLAGIAPGSSSDKPTSGLTLQFQGIKPSEEESSAGRLNFAILQVNIHTIEWLYLANEGHRRALFTWDNNILSYGWLVP